MKFTFTAYALLVCGFFFSATGFVSLSPGLLRASRTNAHRTSNFQRFGHQPPDGGNEHIIKQDLPPLSSLIDGAKPASTQLGAGVDDWITSSAAKVQYLERAQTLILDMFSAARARLLDHEGNVVSPDYLRNTSVALYFAASWCEDCSSFTPALVQFYNAHQEYANGRRALSVVFVSSDEVRLLDPP